MIKINLLPVKYKKRDYRSYGIFIQTALILGLTILILGALSIHLAGKVSDMKDEKAAKEKRLAELDVLIKEVKNYEKDNKSCKEKNSIIEQLKNNQRGPVRLLDEISLHLPSGVWLTTLIEKEGLININGYAFTNSDLVNYVQNLKSSNYLSDVTLLESRQTTLESTSLYQFKLTLKVKV